MVDGVFRPQQNLVLAIAGLQRDCARRMVPFLVLSFDLQCLAASNIGDSDHGNSIGVGGHTLAGISYGVGCYFSLGRTPVRIRSKDENLIFQIRNQRTSLWNCRDKQR